MRLLSKRELETAYEDDPRVYQSCKVDRCAVILVICSFLLGLCCVGLVWNYLS